MKAADNRKCWVKRSLISRTDWNDFTWVRLLKDALTEVCSFKQDSNLRLYSRAITSITPRDNEWTEDSRSTSTEVFHSTHHHTRRQYAWMKVKSDTGSCTFQSLRMCHISSNRHITIKLLENHERRTQQESQTFSFNGQPTPLPCD